MSGKWQKIRKDLKRLWAPSGSKNSELGQQKQECTLIENMNVLFLLAASEPFLNL